MATRKLNKTVKRIITNLFIAIAILILATACSEEDDTPLIEETECECEWQKVVATHTWGQLVPNSTNYGWIVRVDTTYTESDITDCSYNGMYEGISNGVLGRGHLICKEKE